MKIATPTGWTSHFKNIIFHANLKGGVIKRQPKTTFLDTYGTHMSHFGHCVCHFIIKLLSF